MTKPRRDITLGEMQDECKKHDGKRCITNGSCAVIECAMKENCVYYNEVSFSFLDLTDPPRFNEAQMALLKAFYDIGGVIVRANSISATNYIVENLNEGSIGAIFERTGFTLEDGERLDLAELLGKDDK